MLIKWMFSYIWITNYDFTTQNFLFSLCIIIINNGMITPTYICFLDLEIFDVK